MTRSSSSPPSTTPGPGTTGIRTAFQVVNYDIAATAVVITACTSAVIGKHDGLAAALAIAGPGLTGIASAAALSVVSTAILAEPALTGSQERIGGRLRTDSIRIARLQPGIGQRRAGGITIFGLAAALDVIALLYALIH